MSIGFLPSNNRRQPIYGEQVSRKVGYVEHDNQKIYFCGPDGRRIARILKYHPHQAPQPSVSATGAYYVPIAPEYR